MEASSIVALGTEVAKVISGILEKLPSHEQKQIEQFYKFMDLYETEIKRADADFDDIIIWRSRKQLMLDTVIQKIARVSEG